MTTLLQDVRYALRTLRQAPLFALVAVATIALGIAANTAIFSVVNALLLRPLPYPASDRLVMVWEDMRGRGGPATEWATPGNYVDWKSQTGVFASITAVRGWFASLSGQGEAEAVVGEQVTYEYFDVLGVRPALGRAFQHADDVPNAPRVAILSHGLWTRRFGSDPGVIGRSVMLSGEPHEVIGVMAAGFRPAIVMAADLWRPARLNTATPSRGAIVLRVVGRLQPGVTVPQAARTLAGLARRLEQEYPDSNKNVGFNPVSMHAQVTGAVRPALIALLSAVAFVLLIACVSVANLLIARGSGRAREVAVRLALGAGRGRVLRQLLTESAVLATLGGLAGVLLGMWGISALVAIAPAGIPRVGEIGVDGRVLLFVAAITLCTGVLFGLVPAWQASRETITPALRDGGRGATAVTGQRTRRVLVVAEVALALVLLVGGGLLLRTFVELQRTNLGFDPTHVLTGLVQPAATKYQTGPQLVALYDRLLEAASGLPGVSAAALSSVIPLGGDSDTSLEIEGRPAPAPGEPGPVAWYRLVSDGYFRAMGMTLARGRSFAAHETAPSIVVNETMARTYWPGEDPIGRRIRGDENAPWFTIIGIVHDVKARGAEVPAQVEMFVPYWQMPERGTYIVLRAEGDPARLAKPLRQMVASIDPDMPVAALEPMTAIVAESIDRQRFLATIAGAFAVFALLLAGIGIYGVMAYTVTERRGEIGVRLALGAQPRQVLALIVGDGLRLTAYGLVLGAVGGLLVGRSLARLLFAVRATDPLTFTATAAILLLVAFAASYFPARRAMRVDPIAALRAE